MRITGKNVKVHELAEELQSRGVEVTASALSSAAMGHVIKRTHLAERYGRLSQKDFINYMREIYANLPPAPSNN